MSKSKKSKQPNKQEIAFRYIFENLLDYGRLRHDMISDQVQIQKPDGTWRDFTTADIHDIVCKCSLETGVQMVFAIAVGFMFTLVRYKGGSLLPCIVAHSLIDVFSVVSRRSSVLDWISIAVCLAVAAIYSIYLWRIEV